MCLFFAQPFDFLTQLSVFFAQELSKGFEAPPNDFLGTIFPTAISPLLVRSPEPGLKISLDPA